MNRCGRMIASAMIVAGLPAVALARNNPPLQAEFELPGVTPPASQVIKPEALSPGPYQPAPMPNPDLLPPSSSASSDPSLKPHLFMPADRFAGDGYTPGSTVQTEQERKLRPAPGFSLQVPLH